MSIEVRDAVEADLAPIDGLNVVGWKVGYRGLLPDAFLDALTVGTRAHLRAWHPTPATPVLVAEDDGVLAGYAVMQPEDGGGMRVRSFYVHPDHWRRGVGRVLMRAVVRRVRDLGHDHVDLWVMDTNARAIAFSRSTGWFLDGVARLDQDEGLPPLPHSQMRHDLGAFVREATLRDAGRIAEIHVAAWRTAYRDFVRPAIFEGTSLLEQRRERWQRALDGPSPGEAVLVAEDDGAVVGFTSFGPSEDADAPEGTGELHTLYLHPDSWRGGVGTRLEVAARERLAAAGFTEATLWAVVGNDRATRFYEKQGWRPDGARRPSPIPRDHDVEDARYRHPL